MRTFKRLLFIVLVLTMVFGFGQMALALVGSASGDTSSLMVYPNAPGTKYEGPLTLNFDDGGMYIFLRLRKGSVLYPFSGFKAGVAYTDIGAQQTAVEAFFLENVLPVLYPGVSPLPTALLKSVDQIVSDNEIEFPGCCDQLFVILDVVIAVQD